MYKKNTRVQNCPDFTILSLSLFCLLVFCLLVFLYFCLLVFSFHAEAGPVVLVWCVLPGLVVRPPSKQHRLLCSYGYLPGLLWDTANVSRQAITMKNFVVSALGGGCLICNFLNHLELYHVSEIKIS